MKRKNARRRFRRLCEIYDVLVFDQSHKAKRLLQEHTKLAALLRRREDPSGYHHEVHLYPHD